MKYLFIFTTLFFSKALIAQDYLVYFKTIREAEMAIIDGNYENAIGLYNNAFEDFDFIFPKDAYIASQVASYWDDYHSFKKFIIKGIKNGLPIESIKRNPHLFSNFDDFSKEKLNNEYLDSLCQVNTARINKSYRDTIIQMVKEDQRLRDKNETFLNAKIFNHKLRPRLFKKWMKQAEEQSQFILEMTKTHGFPSHKIIGTHRIEDYDKFGTSYKSQYATIILFHYDFAYQLFEEVLPEQLRLGNISPKQVALLRDFATRHLMFGKEEDKLYEDYQYFIRWTHNSNKKNEIKIRDKWIAGNIETINKEREKIGLVPLDYQNKIKEIQFLYGKNYENLKTEKMAYFDFNYWGWE
jgi:hypothetical protein